MQSKSLCVIFACLLVGHDHVSLNEDLQSSFHLDGVSQIDAPPQWSELFDAIIRQRNFPCRGRAEQTLVILNVLEPY